MKAKQKITTNLWFNRQAEEAVAFYTSIFKDSEVLRRTRYTKEGQEFHKMPEGAVMTIEFRIEGQKFVALNGGPEFRFTEAVSFIIDCDSQEEIDYYWEKLSAGGDEEAQQCGWLKDRFGVSWQVVPSALTDMLQSDDTAKAQRVLKALFQMKKIDIKTLQQAYEGVALHQV
ncbi:VOC family protein [Pontibacter ruber]|uniref:VOC family protein n=1 Tax=Pontibacter ruber TaxID=1343895 RepID=A0ABW5CWU5_9BACT|nr:VOC family protein [Pontibacter ruber]